MNSAAKHLIVISIDSLNSQDFNRMMKLSAFSQIIKNGSYAREVVGIYPSLTYPSHASIITGVYPDKHGLFTNEIMEPGVKRQAWYWYRKYIKVPTLCDIAKEANMKIANVFWPVMGGAKIDYNCPEIWTVEPRESQILKSLRAGSPIFLFNIFKRFGKLLNGIEEPQLDNFSTESIAYVIKAKKPNLVLLHLNEVDHTRHKLGFNALELDEVFMRMNGRINKIINSAKEAGIYKDTVFVILGDHGFADVDYRVCLNTKFVQKGLINLDKNGEVKEWRAYLNYCDGSAQIKVKDKNAFESVKSILMELKNTAPSPIKRVYTKQEVELEKRVTGDFDFMIEANDGYYFDNDWNAPEIINRIVKSKSRVNEYDYYVATHGYDPMRRNYRTFFAAAGPSIKKGFSLPQINLVDEGPTIARMLGLNMKNVDGRVIEEIFT